MAATSPAALIELFEADLHRERDPDLRALARRYLQYHARRYGALLRVVSERLAEVGDPPTPRILDVGPNFQTGLFRRAIPGGVVDTLGFAHGLFPPRSGERHVHMDLNQAEATNAPAADGEHHVVVLAEVIEHLHTSPVLVLRHLKRWMRPDGALIVQTPNAVALHKRLLLLAGRNPYEPIRLSRENPGHFHEYTLGELQEAAGEAGLVVGGWELANYFGDAGLASRGYAAAGRLLPQGMRHGITMWLRPGA